MGRTSKKLNFLIEEELCRDLETLVPAGKRSKVVNEALRKELESIRRKKSVEKLLGSPPAGKEFSNREIIEGLSKDRRTH
jgi:Arc/MetJ-type ribon-helix-helix transcriptional regulator